MLKKKILHICEKSTFLISIIEKFEECYPGQNIFFINMDLVQHMDFDYGKFSMVYYYRFELNEWRNFIINPEDNFFLAIFHNIGLPYKYEIAKELYNKVPIHGILWGWEIYDSPRLNKMIYTRNTLNIVPSLKIKSPPIYNVRTRLKYEIRKLRTTNLETNRHKKLFHLLSSYSTILDSEVGFLRNFYNYVKPSFPFVYSEDFGKEKSGIVRKGFSVQIGNSAAIANNHFDILQYLIKDIQHINRIIVPLSYGDEDYAFKVDKRYKKCLGDKYIGLKEFVPLQEYYNLISDCGFVIMNHIRQQAMGNIFLSLLQGAKVFLNKKGMAYQDLKKQGYIIYSLEEFHKEVENLETLENIEHNKVLVIENRGPEIIKKNIRAMVDFYKLGRNAY